MSADKTKMPLSITLKCGTQAEGWLTIYPDGRIAEHVEADGYAFMRKPWQRDTELTMAEVETQHPQHVPEIRAYLTAARGTPKTIIEAWEEYDALVEREHKQASAHPEVRE
jgi:hypothetical protein